MTTERFVPASPGLVGVFERDGKEGTVAIVGYAQDEQGTYRAMVINREGMLVPLSTVKGFHRVCWQQVTLGASSLAQAEREFDSHFDRIFGSWWNKVR